jgi:hypothetical protein
MPRRERSRFLPPPFPALALAALLAAGCGAGDEGARAAGGEGGPAPGPRPARAIAGDARAAVARRASPRPPSTQKRDDAALERRAGGTVPVAPPPGAATPPAAATPALAPTPLDAPLPPGFAEAPPAGRSFVGDDGFTWVAAPARTAGGAGGGISGLVHSRVVGDATVRFWLTRVVRTGRTLQEYHFAVSVQNRGSSLLQGAVLVASGTPASRVVDACAPFGVTPPGLTRSADDGFVVAQDRSVAFDPTALGFLLRPAPDPTLCHDPGRVTMRRLNRAEYDNTVRDLLGTSQRPAAGFPTDDSDHGFDTIGEALSFSPLLFEKAERAAAVLVEEALRVVPPGGVTQRFEAELGQGECGSGSNGYWHLWSACGVRFPVSLAFPGTYEIRVRAYQDQAGGEDALMQVRANGLAIGAPVAVRANSRSAAAVYTVTTRFVEGGYDVKLEFLNDYYQAPADRNLHIDWMEIVGPLDAPPPPAQIQALRALCNPQLAGALACHRQWVAAFGRRAWRRPLTSAEVEAVARLADDEARAGAPFEQGVAVALRAILTSPHFLFKVERGPHPLSVERTRLSNHELATRLAYFLWSSTPDEELLALADQGRLQEEAVINAQVHRLVFDPRFAGFIESFGGQWLALRALDDVNPDPRLFPGWDEHLRVSMRAETLSFLLSLAQSNRSFLDLLDADFSFVNDRLAQHYGLPLPGSLGPVHTPLAPSTNRGGILTHGSLLAVHAQMSRTSPVKRGKWALDQLLCIDIPPPPPGVEGLLDAPGSGPPTGTLRERLAQHRANPECAACHAYLDPIGLGLENYDAIGAWRTHENGIPIDASGQMPDGRSFAGPRQLAATLKADPSLGRCIVERVVTYALGRGLGPADDAELERITSLWAHFGHRFEALLSLIAQSEPFRSRRGEPAGGTP